MERINEEVEQLTWDEYFLFQAISSSLRSKDPSTKVGCVIVDENNHQVSMGYNGFVAQAEEGKFTWEKDKRLPYHETKYAYVIHAEANAILHSNKSLEGCRLYVTLFPCNECAKMIATKKIKEVIFLTNPDEDKSENIASKNILSVAGVNWRQMSLLDDRINDIFKLITNVNSKK